MRFYSLTRGTVCLIVFRPPRSGESYANRAVAMYRHVAGIPTDRDPPNGP